MVTSTECIADALVKKAYEGAAARGIPVVEIRAAMEKDVRIYHVVIDCERIDPEWFSFFSDIEMKIYKSAPDEDIDFRFIPAAAASGVVPKCAKAI